MPSPEWLIERGIGETRMALVADGRIIEARILQDDVIQSGTVLKARLKTTGRNAVATADGQEFMLPKGAPGVTEGAGLTIEVTREAVGSTESWKRPLARLTDAPPGPAILPEGREVDGKQLDDAGWLELIDEARSRIISFDGGELRVSLTPAMTLIDVDGHLPPAQLARVGARAAAECIRRHGVTGSTGIDLPTIEGKAARQAAAAEVDAILPAGFERTAVNGFGFLQVVRPRRFASMFELAADTANFEARTLLRQAGREIGGIALVAHPAVTDVIDRHPDWVQRLSKQTGGAVALRADPALPMSAGYAERL